VVIPYLLPAHDNKATHALLRIALLNRSQPLVIPIDEILVSAVDVSHGMPLVVMDKVLQFVDACGQTECE
jgi:hypothetical protein